MKRYLVIGGSGFLGKACEKVLGAELDSTSTTGGKKRIKFSLEKHDIQNQVDLDSYEFVIVLSGITNTITCALNKDFTREINVRKTLKLFKTLSDYSKKILYISSDLVFDGAKGNYNESDIPTPIVEYGMQKLLCEQYLVEYIKSAVVLRSTRVIDYFENNILTTWIEKIKKGNKIYLAQDNKMNPIHRNDLVLAIKKAFEFNLTGIYNVSGLKTFSSKSLFEELVRSKNIAVNSKLVEYVNLNDLQLPEKRPLDTTLDSSLFFNKTNLIRQDILKK
mgnify:CR=1 FL=1